MSHIFRKYTSNRGSALFMVISTMTALLISCMAMYFSMSTARSSQYAVFNQMQASQSAQSIATIIKNSIQDPANHGAGGGVILEKTKELDIYESITTDANGFKSLDPNVANGLDESQLGAYSVTITRLEDYPNGDKRFDLMVISSVEGNKDVVHLELGYNESSSVDMVSGEDGSGGDAELFAATGYVPNDAYISGGYYLTNVFYDTQFTYMNTYGGSGENRIGQDLYTGGDLMLGTDAMTVVHSASTAAISAQDVGKIGPVTWAIRGNFYPNLNSDFGMRGGSQILVGGDFTFDSGNNSFYVKNGDYTGSATLDDHICVYVNGDLNYSGSAIKSNVWFFVNGNVYNVGGTQQNNARLFVTGNAEERAAKTSGSSTSMPIEEWPQTGSVPGGLSYTEAIDLLGRKTQTISYYKWDLSKNTESTDTQHIDIRLNATNNSFTDDKGNTFAPKESTYIISYDNNTDSAKYLKQNGGYDNGVVGKSFVIDSVWTHTDNNTCSEAIIIDTGDDPNNIMTIKLSDVTGNGEFTWFMDREVHTNVISWWPYEAEVTYGPFKPTNSMPNHGNRMVLVKGRGTVLIDVPKGITYQDVAYQFTGHVGWWLIEGGNIETQTIDGKKHMAFGENRKSDGQFSAKIVPYIHKTCEDGDGCTFTMSSSSITCNECKGDLTQVSCNIHGDVNKYCPACHPEKASRTDWCTNHVDKLKFDSFYAGLSGQEKAAVTGKDGEIVYPTTNFMLVSCDESAEMRFSKLGDGSSVQSNTFYGFIYAPYMSYLAAKAAQAGGVIKLCGGMTVGDYDIQAIDSFIGCYPDKMPNELANMAGGGSMAGGKLTGTTKSWKIEIGGYR
ncbi:MAG: hypothetical protein K2J80_13860 [Oscillospiraceae bacterium]|nr:hypothetical protein [Oscillospiraceae bacterium]